MNSGSLALAFATGMVATVNPCGFAMLPAYLAYFLGTDDDDTAGERQILRAMLVGLTVSGGFLLVFVVIGFAITTFSLSIEERLPWITMVIGVVLAGLGVALLAGREPTLRLPSVGTGGAHDRRLVTMFFFGVSFAVSSLSCTISIFLVNVSSVFNSASFAAGMAVFVAYALGMALVLMALTVALSLARQGFVQRLRNAGRYLNRIAGGLLVVAGLYLTYYGWYELQVYAGNTSAPGPADAVFRANSALTGWVVDTGPLRIGVVLAAALGVALAVSRATRDRGASGHTD